MPSIQNIASAVPSDVTLTETDRAAILEIAFLAVAADHKIHQEEEAALRAIAKRISPASVDSEAEIDALLLEIGGRIDRETADTKLREVASRLSTVEARSLAYKAAYALALADLASTDEEFEFDLQLIDALHLEQDVVDQLTADVVRAVSPPIDGKDEAPYR